MAELGSIVRVKIARASARRGAVDRHGATLRSIRRDLALKGLAAVEQPAQMMVAHGERAVRRQVVAIKLHVAFERLITSISMAPT